MEKDISEVLGKYISKGSKVAELYHGEKSDILRSLSDLVGEKGKVYGIDSLNPFENYKNMAELKKVKNIDLVSSKMPEILDKIRNLDAIAIREFMFAYEKADGAYKPDKKINSAISSALKNKGYLALVLKGTERNSEDKYQIYENNIKGYPDKFNKVYDKGNLLVFQKE